MRTKMLLLTGVLVAVLFGCASHQQTATSTPSSRETSDSSSSSTPGVRIVKSRDGSFDGEIIGTPAPNSKFAKLQIGMGQREVYDLIGQPNDSSFHGTGKGFIPFYFGSDKHRWKMFYKNEGQLTFSSPAHFASGTFMLFRISVDPNPTFSTGGSSRPGRRIDPTVRPKGLHYKWAWSRQCTSWPAAVIRGGGWGGRVRPSRSTKSRWSGLGSV
jgi:hypothetical protein